MDNSPIFKCPSFTSATTLVGYLSYGLNALGPGQIGATYWDQVPKIRKKAQIKFPSDICNVAETVYASNPKNGLPTLFIFKDNGNCCSRFSHSKRMSGLFCDGSAQSIPETLCYTESGDKYPNKLR